MPSCACTRARARVCVCVCVYVHRRARIWLYNTYSIKYCVCHLLLYVYCVSRAYSKTWKKKKIEKSLASTLFTCIEIVSTRSHPFIIAQSFVYAYCTHIQYSNPSCSRCDMMWRISFPCTAVRLNIHIIRMCVYRTLKR